MLAQSIYSFNVSSTHSRLQRQERFQQNIFSKIRFAFEIFSQKQINYLNPCQYKSSAYQYICSPHEYTFRLYQYISSPYQYIYINLNVCHLP